MIIGTFLTYRQVVAAVVKGRKSVYRQRRNTRKTCVRWL